MVVGEKVREERALARTMVVGGKVREKMMAGEKEVGKKEALEA